MKTICWMLTSVALLLPVTVSAEEPARRFQVVVDRLVDAINREDYAGMGQDFDQAMQDGLPVKKREEIFKPLSTSLGKIKKVDAPRLVSPDQAIFPAHFERAVVDIKIVLDDRDKISSLWLAPRVPGIPVPKKHATPLRLPFEGRWRVVSGGDTRDLNQHHDCPSQTFAFDFVGVDDCGETHESDGAKNEDFLAFGRNVLAPADGVVTDVIQGVRDNRPGSMNPFAAVGNAVVIRHRKHEVSVLAHFKDGSIRVKVGDKVKRGEVLGLCGNSGNSSGPHIHYHLQNTPVLQDGTGIKCFFDNVKVVRGEKTTSEKHYSPVRDEIVEPSP